MRATKSQDFSKNAGLTGLAKGGLRRRRVSRSDISDHALRQIDRADPLRLPSGNQSRLGAFKRESLKHTRTNLEQKHHGTHRTRSFGNHAELLSDRHKAV